MRFTLQQINEAQLNSKDNFSKLVEEFKKIGVDNFVTQVEGGHTDYFDADNNDVSADGFQDFTVSDNVNKDVFIERLKLHKNGETDFPTFCQDCAENGVNNWIVDIPKMTCTYYDKVGNEVLKEEIPTV